MPFIAEELLRDWRTEGALAWRDQGWALVLDQSKAGTPPSVARVVQQRLAQLASEDLAILQIAAVAGREFTPALVATAGDVGVDVAMAALDRAASLRLVQPGPGRETFAFHHETIRSGILREINTFRHRQLHAALGRALEESGVTGDPRGLAGVAFHFAHSTERALGAHYALLAGQQSLRASAFEEARRQFAVALALLPADDDRRGELLLGHGESASLAGYEAEAMASLSAAQSWFQACRDPRATHAAHLLGRVAWRQEQIETARTAFRAALAILGERRSAERVEVLVDLGTLQAVSEGELTAGLEQVREAVALAEALGDQRLLATARRAQGNLLVRANDLPAGIALLEDALVIAVATGDLTEAAECCACLAPACWWQGDIARSEAVTQQRLAFALTSHDRFQLRHVYPWLAVCAGVRARIPEALEGFARAEDVISGLESPEPRAYLSFARGALALEVSDLAQARVYLDEALAIFRPLGSAAAGWYEGFVGLLDYASGDLAAAHEALANLAALVESLPAGAMAAGEPLVCAAQLALYLHDSARYAPLQGLLERYPGQFHDFLVDRLRGELALRLGALTEAGLLLTAAKRQARIASLLWELVRGQSNRAIADALFLAPKTIEHHLTSIYTKLQVENRAQAAAFAVRHGLT